LVFEQNNRDIAEDEYHSSHCEHRLRMDKTISGEENLCYQLESPKKESAARIYDDLAAEPTTPVLRRIRYEENTRGAKKKNKQTAENASQSDTVLIRRLVSISTAVVAVAFLTAAATLVLALSLMMSRNDNTGSKTDLKECGAIYGKYSHKLFSLRAAGNNIVNCTCRLSTRKVSHVGQKRKMLDSYTDRHLSMQLTLMYHASPTRFRSQ